QVHTSDVVAANNGPRAVPIDAAAMSSATADWRRGLGVVSATYTIAVGLIAPKSAPVSARNTTSAASDGAAADARPARPAPTSATCIVRMRPTQSASVAHTGWRSPNRSAYQLIAATASANPTPYVAAIASSSVGAPKRSNVLISIGAKRSQRLRCG